MGFENKKHNKILNTNYFKIGMIISLATIISFFIWNPNESFAVPILKTDYSLQAQAGSLFPIYWNKYNIFTQYQINQIYGIKDLGLPSFIQQAYADKIELAASPTGVVTNAVTGLSCGTTPYSFSSGIIERDSQDSSTGCRAVTYEFNTSTIPDGSTINSVTFKESTALVTGGDVECSWKDMTYQPSTSSAQTVWEDIHDATTFNIADLLCNNAPAATNKATFVLPGAAPLLQGHLIDNWFALGGHFTVEGRDSFGYFSSMGTSYLVVDYTPPTPVGATTTVGATNNLIDDVNDLINDGSLNDGQGNSLISKLQNIIAKIKNGQTSATCNQLNSFINQVNGFINGGTLTTAEGQPLIDDAQAIKVLAGC